MMETVDGRELRERIRDWLTLNLRRTPTDKPAHMQFVIWVYGAPDLRGRLCR